MDVRRETEGGGSIVKCLVREVENDKTMKVVPICTDDLHHTYPITKTDDPL